MTEEVSKNPLMFSNLLSLLGNINDNDDHMLWCLWIEIEDCQDIYSWKRNNHNKIRNIPECHIFIWYYYCDFCINNEYYASKNARHPEKNSDNYTCNSWRENDGFSRSKSTGVLYIKDHVYNKFLFSESNMGM